MCNVVPHYGFLFACGSTKHPALRGLKDMVAPKSKNKRRKPIFIKVYCLSQEYKQIEDMAVACGKSLSAYLRMRGLSHFSSYLDPTSIKSLAELNANQGRLGGLLKALLTNDERLDGYTGQQIKSLTHSTLAEIKETQELLKTHVQEIFKRKRT